MPWFLLSPTSITLASPFPKHSLYLSTSVHFITIAQALWLLHDSFVSLTLQTILYIAVLPSLENVNQIILLKT